ncbi:TetR/AcrR family transcriptional regulator [Nonomuraea roseoviolacea subsp. roseoviolacea]
MKLYRPTGIVSFMPRPSSRDRLLDAAAEVLLSDGAESLTLEAVAQRAGVSKGGLFYHFPTKQALVRAMVERLVGAFDQALARAGDRPGDFLRAYVEATVPETRASEAPDRVTAALLAGVLVDPEGLEPLRERFAAWQERLTRDGVDPAAATVVRLAVDGWWAVRLLGLGEPDPELHARTRAYLMELITRAAND